MVALNELVWGKRDGTTTSFLPPPPSLRATSPQGEAFCKAPIEGSCRQNRLRGGDRKNRQRRPMIAPTKYKNAQKNTAVSAVSKTYTYWGSKCFKWGSYHNYKRCNIYMKQISKIFVTFKGDPCLWGRQGHMKKGWYRLFLHSLSIKTG